MALQCPIGFDVEQLRVYVRETYAQVAADPYGDFHFHRGAAYAASVLGYDADELAALPDLATSRFAGVANPLAIAPIAAGSTVLDHACGAGMDLLLAARRVGPTGYAIGVDMTEAMRDCAEEAARLAGLTDRVELRRGIMEELPVRSASVDVVISNGVVNLSPDKERVFAEIERVLKPGGRLLLGDVVVARELTLDAREQPALWAACVGGALQPVEFVELAERVGLVEACVLDRFDCYRGTSAQGKVSSDLHLGAVNFTAAKRP